MADGDIVKLERRTAALKKSLRHWRLWDADYEYLKEEVAATSSPSSSGLADLRRSFPGNVIGPQELDDLLAPGRSRGQVLGLLERRIEYVSRNLATLERQVDESELALADLTDAAAFSGEGDRPPDHALPLTEIIEELDDDDNVLSYQLLRPGDALPQITESLRRAGVRVPDGVAAKEPAAAQSPATVPPAEKENEAKSKPPSPSPSPSPATATATALPARQKPGARIPASVDDTDAPQKPATKAVTFAEDTKPGHAVPSGAAADRPKRVSRTARRVEAIMKTARDKEKEAGRQSHAIPADESPEDAALRREMIGYSMGEVGAVVAELEVEERSEDGQDSDYYDSDGVDFDAFDEGDGEDARGMSTEGVITDDYRKRMSELERRLGVANDSIAREGLRRHSDSDSSGSDTDSDSHEVRREGIARIRVKSERGSAVPVEVAARPDAQFQPSPAPVNGGANDGQRGVRFASSPNVTSPDRDRDLAAATPSGGRVPDRPRDSAHGDVVERLGPAETPPQPSQPSQRKVSQFKMAVRASQHSTPSSSMMADNDNNNNNNNIPKGPFDIPARFLADAAPPVPTGPVGQVLSDRLVERKTTTTARPEDEWDPGMLELEIADEHHRLRNKFMHREGGFLKEDESVVRPVEPEESPRISRFKAARLSRQ